MTSDLQQRTPEENSELALTEKWLQRILTWASLPALVLTVILNRTYLALVCGIWLAAAIGYLFIKKTREEKPLELGIGTILDEKQPSQAHDLAPRKETFLITPPETKEQERLAPIETQRILDVLKGEYDVKKLEPNITPSIEGEVIDVHEGEHGIIVEGVRGDARNFRAVVLPYHNSPHPKRRISAVSNVSAKLVYKFFGGSRFITLHRGAWLSKKDNRVNLGNNDRLSLILAIIKGADEVYVVRRDFDDANPNGITRHERLVEDLSSVHIRLTTELDGTTVNDYEVMLEVIRAPDFEIRLIKSLWWKSNRLDHFVIEGYELTLRIYKDGIGEKIVDEVKIWETRVADFIEKHLDKQQKAIFLNCVPSIDEGVQNARRNYFLRPLLPQQGAQKDVHTPLFWSLPDSIKARTDKLKEFQNRL